MKVATRIAISIAVLLSVFLVGLSFAADPGLPNAKQTPGQMSPIVNAENLPHTVCSKGYTERIRPPGSYTSYIKKRQLLGKLNGGAYKSAQPTRSFEEDHLVPLCAGGHPTALGNLWPQPIGPDNNAKDACEHKACRQLCAGKLQLADVQKGFATNWRSFCAGLT